jgi:DnaJ-domain-containing protein 1
LSEYEFLNVLREQVPAFQTDRNNPVSLFRQHFILFHGLYRLQQDLLNRRQAQLQISPLRIVLHPYLASVTEQMTQADPLRRYYLDLTQLHATGAKEVEALLDAFWMRMTRDDQRKEALQVLGLSDPVNDSTIRRRYRELVMVHHPDRGGETARLQLLNAAVASLLPRRF